MGNGKLVPFQPPPPEGFEEMAANGEIAWSRDKGWRLTQKGVAAHVEAFKADPAYAKGWLLAEVGAASDGNGDVVLAACFLALCLSDLSGPMRWHYLMEHVVKPGIAGGKSDG